MRKVKTKKKVTTKTKVSANRVSLKKVLEVFQPCDSGLKKFLYALKKHKLIFVPQAQSTEFWALVKTSEHSWLYGNIRKYTDSVYITLNEKFLQQRFAKDEDLRVLVLNKLDQKNLKCSPTIAKSKTLLAALLEEAISKRDDKVRSLNNRISAVEYNLKEFQKEKQRILNSDIVVPKPTYYDVKDMFASLPFDEKQTVCAEVIASVKKLLVK